MAKEEVSCIICGSSNRKKLFSKASRSGELFTLVRCSSCGLQFVSPRPSQEDMDAYYGSEYFSVRTDRGYNDYFSDPVRKEIERVMGLNLRDLGFYAFEGKPEDNKSALDIGCAAGYFVYYLKERGWHAMGIDVSRECVSYGQNAGLDIRHGDYLAEQYRDLFDLITLWASIEHLRDPDRFLEKIYNELKDGGILYISTCRAGGCNFMKLFGKRWRYYNFPEHLYFFSHRTIKKILELHGFRIIKYVTYGSGVGKPGSMTRRICDWAAKRLYMGDMMLIAAQKNRSACARDQGQR